MVSSTGKSFPDQPPIAGIILAAGTGSRMGKTKQLLPFKGIPLLAHTIEQGLAAGLCPLILVLGHRAGDIQAGLPDFPIDVVINPEYSSGLASSLKTGLKRLYALREKPAGALFLLGDQPLVTPDTILEILNAARKATGRIIIPTFHGKRGNPVYFDACFFDRLGQLTEDIGGRKIVSRFPHLVTEIPVTNPGICLDIDTREDYASLCQDPKE